MFYNDYKNQALADHKSALDKYKRIFKSFVKKCEQLYKTRVKACSTVEIMLDLINSIANKPKEFITNIEEVTIENHEFHETVEYQKNAEDSLKWSAFGTVAGVGVGTAIATLSTSALAGPIGLGIGVVGAAGSLFGLSKQNKKIAEKAIKETEQIKSYTQEIRIVKETVKTIRRKILLLNFKLRLACLFLGRLKNSDYVQLSEKNKIRLGTLVNNTLTLTHLVNEKVD